MFVLLLTAIVAVVYNAGPRLAFWVMGRRAPDRATWLPFLATATVVIAWFLPPFSVSAGSDTFLLHAVGGGLSATLIAYYVATNLEVGSAALRAALALALVSVFGVANEILELAYDQLVGTHLSADASSDLVANTVGAMAAIALCEMVLRTQSMARE